MFPIAARFNHACRPRSNVDYHFDEDTCLLVLSVRSEEGVAANTELTIDYYKSPLALFQWHEFLCECGACEPLIEEEIQSVQVQW